MDGYLDDRFTASGFYVKKMQKRRFTKKIQKTVFILTTAIK